MAIRDREGDVRGFLEEGDFDLPVFMDPAGAMAGRYGVTAVPTTVVVDSEGRIVTTQVGQASEDDLEALVADLR